MALSTISGTTGITDATITSAKLADFSAAVDLNGVELILDADQDTTITADTDDRIDFKIAGVEHFSFSNSSGDTIIKPMVDAKDIVFQQYDGNKILEINDANYVAISGAAAGPGELRFYEDTDLGSHYTGFKAGNATESISYILPLADASSSGYALTSNASGVLSWAAGGAISTYSNSTNNRVITSVDSSSVNSEANLTFDGSTLAVTGAATVSGALTGSSTVQGTTITATTAFVPDAQDGAALGTTSLQFSDLFLADSAVLGFGDDNDTTLTHTDGTGLTLNSTNKLCFNDASQFIYGVSNAILGLGATDEIDLTATLVDINANVEISGTATTTGVHTFTAIPVLPANSIDSTHYVDGSIDEAHMSANSIDSDSYVDGSIDNAHIADDAIDSEHYADGSIDNAHIADDAIDSEHYADGSIDNAHIADDAIDSEHYADGSIDNAHIADDAIDSEHYAAGSIDTAHIAADQITNAKIADDQIDSEHYVDGSIDTAHIADNQITLAKLAGGTDGNIISYDASGDPVAIATGSDGQVLTSTGAGSPPAFEAAAGGMNALISTTAVSNDDTLSITGMDSTYSRYIITITELVAETDNVTLYAQPIIGGAIKTDAYHPYAQYSRVSDGGTGGSGSTDSTFWKINVSGVGNASTEHYNSTITIYNPSSTSLWKMLSWDTVHHLTNDNIGKADGGGSYINSVAAVTGIRFYFSSDGMVSGEIKLWGMV